MYEWLHPISHTVKALLKSGLVLDFLNEHEVLVWRHYPGMIETGEDQFEQAPGLPRIPLSFSIGGEQAPAIRAACLPRHPRCRRTCCGLIMAWSQGPNARRPFHP
ncbi:hypothetical protein LP421_22085 [Rhizobium sp. RCAM05350]|nr:hypothetical protein LP421_22085 [Rhizobium sp. RCAM05350]